MTKKTVYIISGPAGVGKSTISSILVRSLKKSAYISGDKISHIPVNGREKPWLSEETLQLTWDNISSITSNLLNYDFDVVIDYVSFPDKVDWLAKSLLEEHDPDIKYVVMLADEQTLRERDQRRPQDEQMGDRCAILLKEFEEFQIPDRYIIDNTHNNPSNIPEIVEEIRSNPRFVYNGWD